MNTPAAVILAAVATTATAQLDIIELLPGYTLGWLHGLSADGSTLGVQMYDRDADHYDAYAWRSGAWQALPRYDQFNIWQGISADGRTMLSESSQWGGDSRLVLVTDGVRTDIRAPFNSGRRTLGALTRDGSTVFYSQHDDNTSDDPGTDRPVELFRFRAGGLMSQPLAALPVEYKFAQNLLAGSREDFFVINARASGDGGAGMHGDRTLIYDSGELIELPTLGDEPFTNSSATAMTPDGSVIYGYELSLGGQLLSWVYRDSTLNELTVPGLSNLYVYSISDDASAMVVSAVSESSAGFSWLVYEDGRAFSAEMLLAANGFMLGEGEQAEISHISGDGSTIAGSIYRGASTPFGPDFALFSLTIPAPAGLLPLAGLVALARRRR